jgi:hypothetical protein
MVGIEIEDAHFETPNLIGPVPSHTYWLANDDDVAPVYNTFEMHWQRKGKMCDFLDNANSDDCFVCNLCNASDVSFCKDAYDESFPGGVGTGVLEIWHFPNFMPSEVHKSVFTFAERGGNSRLRSACPSNTHLTFTPETNGLYRFTFPEQMQLAEMRTAVRGETEGTAKIFVVYPTSKYATFYQLTSHNEGVQLPDPCATPSPTPTPTNSSCAGCAWLKVPAPVTTNGYREESFSPNVRITKVVVLKGTPAVDPNTGRFKLDETSSVYVHPSRIVLFPSFSDGDSVLGPDRVRCYTDSSETGGLDLRTCRVTRNIDCNTPNCVLNATPQYLHDRVTDPLTWFVEFNPAEGGIIPTLNCGEVLAIEFTLERV